MPLFKVRNLTFAYKNKLAVNHINMNINQGEMVAFLGPNGAGKSTTMRMLTGLTKPKTGTVSLNGISPSNNDFDHQIGITFQDNALDNNLTVKQNLKLRFKMYHHLDPSFVKMLIKSFGLTGFLNQKYGTLSGGQKRRVDITRSLINKPKLLFLDEPSTGLDLQTRLVIWRVLRQLRHKYQLSILLTTHYLEEADQADYAYVIDHGSIIAHDTMSNLRDKYAGYILNITSSKIAKIKKLLDPSWKYQINHNHIKIMIPNLKSGIEFLNQVKNLISNVSFRRGDMNDIFIALTGKSVQ
ncbi:MAG: ABC transporter ATP-binding protein [Acetilactobacillus jinshanensis]